MIQGMGWTDGEDVERLWSDSRHVIAANQSTGAYTRRQTLTNLNMAIGRSRVRNFPNAARKKIEILQEEASSMKAFLLKSANSTIHIEDDICEHLQAMEDFRTFELGHAQAVETAGMAWIKYRLDIALKTEGRISQDLDITWQVLEAHVLRLLKIAGQAMEDWIQGGVKTELYLNRSKEIKLTNLRRWKMEIFRHLVLRKKEWNGLIDSSLHGSPIICTFVTI